MDKPSRKVLGAAILAMTYAKDDVLQKLLNDQEKRHGVPDHIKTPDDLRKVYDNFTKLINVNQQKSAPVQKYASNPLMISHDSNYFSENVYYCMDTPRDFTLALFRFFETRFEFQVPISSFSVFVSRRAEYFVIYPFEKEINGKMTCILKIASLEFDHRFFHVCDEREWCTCDGGLVDHYIDPTIGEYQDVYQVLVENPKLLEPLCYKYGHTILFDSFKDIIRQS